MLYAHAISATKREANNRVMQMVLEAGKKSFQHPRGVRNHKRKKVRIAPAPLSAPLEVPLNLATCHKTFVFLGFMAGTKGLEPSTSAVTGQRSNQLSYVPT